MFEKNEKIILDDLLIMLLMDDEDDDVLIIGLLIDEMVDEDDEQIFVSDEILCIIDWLSDEDEDELLQIRDEITGQRCADDENKVILLVLEHSEHKLTETLFEFDFLQTVIMSEIDTLVMVEEVDGMDDENDEVQVLQILGLTLFMLEDEADLFGKDKIQFLQDIWFLKIIFWMKSKI